MSDCCLIKKVATVEVYENKNEVRAYGFMSGDRNTPVMEVKFKHLFGEESLSECKLRWIIVDDLGSLLVGEVPIEQDNTASIQLPNELFNGERRMKVQLTVASCDGSRILNLQQFTDLKAINNLATNEAVEPVYDILINKLYDGDLTFVLDNFNTLKAEYQKNNALLGEALNGMVSNSRLTNNSITSDKLRIAEDSNKIKLVNLSDEVISAMSGNSPVRPEIGAGEVVTEKIADKAVNGKKTTFLDEAINLLNPNDPDIIRGNLNGYGAVDTSYDSYISGYIPVEEGVSYIRSGSFGSCFYTANKEFVQYAGNDEKITVPLNKSIKFVRITIQKHIFEKGGLYFLELETVPEKVPEYSKKYFSINDYELKTVIHDAWLEVQTKPDSPKIQTTMIEGIEKIDVLITIKTKNYCMSHKSPRHLSFRKIPTI